MSRRGAPGLGLGPEDIFTLFTGPEVPDPITFVIGEQWLDRGNLYPRQATLLKLFFLRDDLFTEYDHMVLNEWIASFASTGNNGVQTDIYRRIAFLKADGYRWFREILLVMGRRAGKGHISALAFAYVLWNYLSKGDPQGFYGVDPDKQLACFIFAGKKEQAKLNLFGDLYNVITSGPCFTSYISRAQTDSLTVYAPHDFIRMRKLAERGLDSGRDMATFLFQPKESTMMAGRGPASFMQGYDEMAHVVASGANRSAEEVYCLDPETRVLCADLIWRPIKDLQAGDELVGFDEEPVEPGGQRKLRHATVRAKWKTRGAALRITFEDGTGVVCSPNHRWFRVSENCNSGKWVKAGYTRRDGSAGSATRLMVGDYIRHLVDPWETDASHEGGWLAGILDGEGWVSSPKSSAFKIGIAQNPGMVLERAERLLKEFGFEYARLAKHPSRKSVCENLEVRGIADVLRLLGQLRPVRLLEKSRGVWDGKTPRGYTKHKRIVSIEELPEQDLIDIETSTGTFVAEGLVSHNSASTPALDQFGKDAFIVEPSSPWQKTGQFYENYQHALEVDEETGAPVYPEVLMIQLASWDIYKDWERAHEIELFPAGFTGDLGEYEHGDLPRLRPLKGSIQTYDLAMQRLERANPETFKVERRCLDPDTRVLDADLRWRPIKNLRVGDRLVAMDEKNPSPGKERRLRTAAVEATVRTRDRAYRLGFDDGTSVVCSGRHRWLSASQGSPSSFRWRSIEALEGRPGPRRVIREGDYIRALVEPWEADESREAGYLAGMYDGEGCVTNRTRNRTEFRIDITQNPGVVLDETVRLLRQKGFTPRDASHHTRRAQVYKITGLSECLRLLGQVRPLRLLQNGNPGMWEGRGLGHENGMRFAKRIVVIEELPEQELIDIQTSTSTFIAEGLVSHNSDWANVMDAYLNENKVKQIFQPWMGRPERYGRPTLEMQESGLLIQTYKAHADPSKSNCNFGFALGHAEEAEDGTLHCVFDKIHHWEPQNWDDGIVDYDEIGEYMVDEIAHKFYPDEITFDQFNSVATIQKINKRLLNEPGPKQVTAYERTATKELNWSRAEVFKTAINMGLVHAPYYELAETELSFLIDKGNKVVDHPDSGPVQTKDVADCMFEVVYYFLGKQIQKMLEALGQERIHGGLQGGTLKIQKTPQLHQPTPNDMFSDFGTSRRMAAQQGLNLSRGYRRR
jgi:hypothetical protein